VVTLLDFVYVAGQQFCSAANNLRVKDIAILNPGIAKPDRFGIQ
jgi:hypothetical protein